MKPVQSPEDPLRTVTAFRTTSALHVRVALLLAVTYFFFQVELDPEEYFANHPPPPDRPAVSGSRVNWETFDKTNAPEAFTADPCVAIGPLLLFTIPDKTLDPCVRPVQPVRDKSPPPPAA